MRSLRELGVLSLHLADHSEQTANRRVDSDRYDVANPVRTERVGRGPVSVRAEPAGDTSDRVGGDHDVSILGQGRGDEVAEERWQQPCATFAVRLEDDRAGIVMECLGENLRRGVNVGVGSAPLGTHATDTRTGQAAEQRRIAMRTIASGGCLSSVEAARRMEESARLLS